MQQPYHPVPFQRKLYLHSTQINSKCAKTTQHSSVEVPLSFVQTLYLTQIHASAMNSLLIKLVSVTLQTTSCMTLELLYSRSIVFLNKMYAWASRTNMRVIDAYQKSSSRLRGVAKMKSMSLFPGESYIRPDESITFPREFNTFNRESCPRAKKSIASE